MLGGTCLPEMQELARAAAGEGMDGISILCPYYFRPDSVATLVEYCSAVARVSPQLPFYYYHIPALTHGHFSMLEFLRLAEERIPNLAGIKYTAPNIMDFHACRLYGAEKYDLLWGTDEALLSGWAVGARGAVGSTYNYAAPLYHRIIAAFQAGDMAEAERLQQQAVRLVQLLVKYGGIGAGKAFMKLIGIDCGWFRPPISHPGPAEVKALRSELETIGFFDFCSQL
jgi:N-acetylneuraminate lyase